MFERSTILAFSRVIVHLKTASKAYDSWVGIVTQVRKNFNLDELEYVTGIMRACRKFKAVFGKMAIPRMANTLKNIKPMVSEIRSSKTEFRKIATKSNNMQLITFMHKLNGGRLFRRLVLKD